MNPISKEKGRECEGRVTAERSSRFLLTFSLLSSLTTIVCLTACSVPTGIAKFTAADAQNAAAMAGAAAAFDPSAPQRIPCWQAWGTLAGSLAKGGKSAGVLSAAEATLEANAAFKSPVCQAIAGQVLLNLAP